MSEERRKRQQVNEPKPTPWRTIGWGAVVLLFAVAYGAGWYHKNHHYDAFAKCLAAKQVKMYGLYWCPHCAEQKERFGKSFQYVPYVECAIKDKPGITEQCQTAGTKMYPSWQFAGNPPKEGELSMEELSDKTGCSLP
jgi:hypothetical protein